MSEQPPFNPTEHLTDIKGQRYLEVKYRLVWLRSVAPDAKLTTRPISIDENLAIIQATVELPDGGSGSGIGSESPKDFGDYIEKAETKAIGRALATLGFGTQFCDDFDTPRIVDAPVRRNGAGDTRLITEQQKRFIWKLAKEKGLSAEDIDGMAHMRWKCQVRDLDRQSASQLIDELQKS